MTWRWQRKINFWNPKYYFFRGRVLTNFLISLFAQYLLCFIGDCHAGLRFIHHEGLAWMLCPFFKMLCINVIDNQIILNQTKVLLSPISLVGWVKFGEIFGQVVLINGLQNPNFNVAQNQPSYKMKVQGRFGG